jgi:dolichol-phosphate mannosyltransferase
VGPRPELSVVIPVRDEVASLDPLVRELLPVLQATSRPFEVLLVDDGSRDGSGPALFELARAHSELQVVTLVRPSGKSAALAAGVERARGDVVVQMDADLQNDPADIPRLLDALATADAACGVRTERRDGTGRRLSSCFANAVRRRVLGGGLRDAGCALKAFRREAILGLPRFDGMHRFLGDMLLAEGFKVVELEVNHRPRRAGRSKYGLGNRALRAFEDLLAVSWMRRRRLRYEVEPPTSSDRGARTGRPPSPVP